MHLRNLIITVYNARYGQLIATFKLCLEGTLHESAVRTGIII
jgi:hypothetical protein